MSSKFSRLATTKLMATSPRQLLMLRNKPINVSIPMTNATAAIGTFNCASNTDRQTKPAPGIPGAPTESTMMEISTDNMAAGGIAIPHNLASENANTLKKTLVPSIFMVAPKGKDSE